MELPKIEVIEVHFWTLLVTDQFGIKEWPERFATKEDAEKKLQELKDKNFTRS
jgi:hypothetical protein